MFEKIKRIIMLKSEIRKIDKKLNDLQYAHYFLWNGNMEYLMQCNILTKQRQAYEQELFKLNCSSK